MPRSWASARTRSCTLANRRTDVDPAAPPAAIRDSPLELKANRTASRVPFQICADYYQNCDTADLNLWRQRSRFTRSLRLAAETGKL